MWVKRIIPPSSLPACRRQAELEEEALGMLFSKLILNSEYKIGGDSKWGKHCICPAKIKYLMSWTNENSVSNEYE